MCGKIKEVAEILYYILGGMLTLLGLMDYFKKK